jgi:cell division septation protein DedD
MGSNSASSVAGPGGSPGPASPPLAQVPWIPFLLKGALLLLMTLLAPSIPGSGQGVAAQEELDRVDRLVEESRYGEARSVLERWWESHDGQPPRADLARGLWYRAILTIDPTLAEMDYRRIVVEYPGGEKADEALLRLAKGAELVGDRSAARRYLEILVQDYPGSPHRVEGRALQERMASLPGEEAPAPPPGTGQEALPNPALERPAEEREPAEPAGETERDEGAEQVPVPEPGAAPAPEAEPTPEPEPEEAQAPQVDQTPEAEPEEAPTPDPEPQTEVLPEAIPQAQEVQAQPDQPYAVQLGAFSSMDGARRMAQDARDNGIQVRIVTVEGSELFRVRSGHFPSRSHADDAAAEIQDRGLETVISTDGDRERPVD